MSRLDLTAAAGDSADDGSPELCFHAAIDGVAHPAHHLNTLQGSMFRKCSDFELNHGRLRGQLREPMRERLECADRPAELLTGFVVFTVS